MSGAEVKREQREQREQRSLFSAQGLPFVTAVVKQNVSSIITRYFLSAMLLRFVGAPLYMKWAFNIMNFTWAHSYSEEWLGAFLAPNDPIGDVVLIKGWIVLLQSGRFLCLYAALCKFLETQNTSMTEVWGSYLGYISGLASRLISSTAS